MTVYAMIKRNASARRGVHYVLMTKRADELNHWSVWAPGTYDTRADAQAEAGRAGYVLVTRWYDAVLAEAPPRPPLTPAEAEAVAAMRELLARRTRRGGTR